MNNAQDLIKKYQLSLHPEGGWYKEIHRSCHKIWSDRIQEERSAVTHIYFLLTKGDISRFHRVLHDEIWNFYAGDPVKLIKYETQKTTQEIIGPGWDNYVSIIPGNTWQAAVTTGDYSLMGCTVAPGFDFADFSFLKDDPAELEKFCAKARGYENFL